MTKSERLRDKAARCIRLTCLINDPDDVALLEAIAAEANQAAADIEAAEHAVTEQSVVPRPHSDPIWPI